MHLIKKIILTQGWLVAIIRFTLDDIRYNNNTTGEVLYNYIIFLDSYVEKKNISKKQKKSDF